MDQNHHDQRLPDRTTPEHRASAAHTWTRIAGSLAAGAALTLVPLGLAAPAAADTPGCVTRAEFRQVQAGMTVRKVRRIFDTYGAQTYLSAWQGPSLSSRGQQRRYQACTSARGYVLVSFSQDRGDPWRASGWKLADWDGN